MSAEDIYLAGTGSFAIEVAEWAQAAGWKVVGLLELLDSTRVGSRVEGLPVLDVASPPDGEARAVVAAGGDRQRYSSLLERHGWRPACVLHPGAHISASARMEPGCVVGPGAVIGARSAIGRHTLVSRGALIGHHDTIGACVMLFPGANLASSVTIGDGARVGMGAVIVDHVAIGAGATVAAGAVVVRDVRAGVRVQGVPAQEHKG